MDIVLFPGSGRPSNFSKPAERKNGFLLVRGALRRRGDDEMRCGGVCVSGAAPPFDAFISIASRLYTHFWSSIGPHVGIRFAADAIVFRFRRSPNVNSFMLRAVLPLDPDSWAFFGVGFASLRVVSSSEWAMCSCSRAGAPPYASFSVACVTRPCMTGLEFRPG